MWNRFKLALFEQVIIPVYNFWAWLLDKIGLVKLIEEDPTKKWPYGYKVEGKIYYTRNNKQLGIESRMSRKFRGEKDD